MYRLRLQLRVLIRESRKRALGLFFLLIESISENASLKMEEVLVDCAKYFK
jgi:hypothetical protein